MASKFNARSAVFTINLIQQVKKEQLKRENDIGGVVFSKQALRSSADMKINRISRQRVEQLKKVQKELGRIESCITVYDQGRASEDLDKNLDGTNRARVDYCSSCYMTVSVSERRKNKCNNCGGQVVKAN